MCNAKPIRPNNRPSIRGGSETQFPGKLHKMMEYVEQEGLESTISWIQDGRAFKVNDPEKLVDLLPMFFSQTKYRSFQRQLNMWHFEKILEGPDRGGWSHPYFIRGNKPLCAKMSRRILDQPHQLQETTTGRDINESKSRNESLVAFMKNYRAYSFSCGPSSISELPETVPHAALKYTENILPTTLYSPHMSTSRYRVNCADDGFLDFAGRNFYSVDCDEETQQPSLPLSHGTLSQGETCYPPMTASNTLGHMSGSQSEWDTLSEERGPYDDLFTDDDDYDDEVSLGNMLRNSILMMQTL